MKIVQLIGSRNKSDFALYLAHTLTTNEKRVLVVDMTLHEEYRYSYSRMARDEYLFEISSIDILCGATKWGEVESLLAISKEEVNQYDCIIIDTDNQYTDLSDVPNISETLYVSDNERSNLLKDVPILHQYLDNKKTDKVRRVHFNSAYPLPDDYIDLLMNNRITLTENSIVLEYDDALESLRQSIQYDESIPYFRLNKDLKGLLYEIACELFEDLTIRDVKKLANKGWIASIFRKKKPSENAVVGG